MKIKKFCLLTYNMTTHADPYKIVPTKKKEAANSLDLDRKEGKSLVVKINTEPPKTKPSLVDSM